jgi:hypothetical protein
LMLQNRVGACRSTALSNTVAADRLQLPYAAKADTAAAGADVYCWAYNFVRGGGAAVLFSCAM